MTGLGHRIAAGATWVVLQRLAVRAIGLLSTVILARLLVPEDFGLVALATTMLVVVETLLELGFDLALIHQQTAERHTYDTAWTLSVGRGLLTGGILLAAAHPIANFYNDARLVPVILWLCVVAILNGCQNIGIVEFRINLQFEKEFRMLVVSKIAMFMVTVGLAWFWRDYRALVAGIMTGKLILFVLSYSMHPYRPRFCLRGAMPLLHFSKWVFLRNIIVLIQQRSDTFVIGKLSSATSLGHYTVAYEISNLATTELISPITRALFPGFAKMQGSLTQLTGAFVASLGIMFIMGAPIAVGVGLIAEHIVHIFLGAQWLPAVPLIQILSLYGLLSLSIANGEAIYLALGRPDLLTWRNLPSVFILPPALIAGAASFGPVGAAWALVLNASVELIVHFWLIRRQLPVRTKNVVAALWRPSAGLLVMSGFVVALDRVWPDAETSFQDFLQTLVLAGAGAGVYFGTIALLWLASARPEGAERQILTALSQWIFASRGGGGRLTAGSERTPG